MRRFKLVVAAVVAAAVTPAVPAVAASSPHKEATTTTSGTSADISTTMSQPGAYEYIYGQWQYVVLAGYTGFYTTVTNNSHTTAAANVQLTDTWSGGLLDVFYGYGVTTSAGQPAPSCVTPKVGTNGPVVCTVGSLGPGQSFTVRVTIKTGSLGPTYGLTNSATARSTTPDPTLADNTTQASVLIKS